jgi:hypothetical protein
MHVLHLNPRRKPLAAEAVIAAPRVVGALPDGMG